MMSRSISQTTAAISQITTAITTTVMIKLNAPRTLLTSSQLKGRDTPAKDTPAQCLWASLVAIGCLQVLSDPPCSLTSS
jgi:hypothetical protein